MPELEVVAWATDGEEKDGVDALVKLLADIHPEQEFVNPVVAGTMGPQPLEVLRSRLRDDKPPDSFQTHPGAELSDYVQAGQLASLSDRFQRWGLRTAIPAGLLESVTVNDAVYAVPLGIHRLLLWSNDEVLGRAGVTGPPATLDELLDHLSALRSSGVEYPLALGTYWTQLELLEAVLLAELGPDRVETLWTEGECSPADDISRALTGYAALLPYTNPDRDGLHWTTLAERLSHGRAGYLFMGDWVIGDLESNGLREYSYRPFPGTEGSFQWLGDAFVLPLGAANMAGADSWLRLVASIEGQESFCARKGAIPVRSDVDTAEYTAYQQAAIADLARLRLVRSCAHGLACSPARTAALAAAVADFSVTPDIAALHEALVPGPVAPE